MPTIDLSDDELAALVSALRRTIADDPYPRAPRLATLKSVLDQLDPRPVKPASARQFQAEPATTKTAANWINPSSLAISCSISLTRLLVTSSK
jgi:hypothetical protein